MPVSYEWFCPGYEIIKKGIKTNELGTIPKRYIIFSCRKDPFGQGLRQYTVYNMVHETGKRIDDKTELICLNAESTKGEVPADIAAFMTMDWIKESEGL